MEALFARQNELLENIQKVKINFTKDSSARKTPDYIQRRIESLDNFWGEFEQNHLTLSEQPDRTSKYFAQNYYQQGRDLYHATRNMLSSYSTEEKATQPSGKVDELLSLQRTNFRSFNRVVKSINVSAISEKWELEDELRNVQTKWNIIDSLHLQIDHLSQGGDISYEDEFSKYELSYKNVKRDLNKKLTSLAHIHQSTPQLEIPVFTGKYTQWPTFLDLFSEAIHENNSITKAQKMQHLKGKVKGEAERLIQHLHVSSENYDTAWEILTHRYNNPQILFTKQIEIFLNQPTIHKQTAFYLKRLYDTSTECIHAIHNLGVDTNTWDPLLVHLLSKKLDSVTYSDYKEARSSPRDLPSLNELMTFIESKFTALEPIHQEENIIIKPQSRITSYQPKIPFNKPTYNKSNINIRRNFMNKQYQAVTTQSNSRCPLCNFHHHLYMCRKFLNMTPDTRLTTLTKLNYCKNCLYNHYDKNCISTKRCKLCQENHNTLIHDACMKSPLVLPVASTSQTQHNVNHVAANNEEILLTTMLLNVLASDGTYVTLRALLDQGSQISLVSENAAQLLGLQRQSYHASISGIGPGSKQSKGIVSLNCQSIYGDYMFETQALVISKVINNLPCTSFNSQSWPHLQHLQLADPEYNVSRSIDLLLDASVYSDIIMEGLIKGPQQAPIAQQTKLGWILSGSIKTFNCHVVINDLSEISKYWEMESIADSASDLTEADKYCEDFYQDTTRRLNDGVYEVALPMVANFEQQLGTSKSKAIAQFKQLENKMFKNPSFADKYKHFIQEYQALDHMKEVDSNQYTNAYYLPHHGVEKPDSTTTQLRVVFNASSKTSSSKSLNDLMYSGPNLQRNLLTLILRWRTHKYVITADIEKMFRQIRIRECDHHLQSIVWRKSPHELLREYRLTTVTYGTKAAPFLAMRTLQQLARDEADNYPLAAPVVENSLYTDDLLSGQDSISKTRELQYQLISMLQSAGMNLRKWSSNVPELLENLGSDQLNSPFEFKCAETRKTLGLKWNPSSDSFTFHNHQNYHMTESMTKRQLLSDIAKLFDPLGWLSPLSIRAKLLFQRAWASGAEWDQILSADIQRDWAQLRTDLNTIDKFTIPRHIGNTNNIYQLHAFCDASDKAFACVIYACTINDKGGSTLTLVAAKTKLVPLTKKVSLPRLELCGALLLSELMQRVLEALPNKYVETYAWSDSMVVLGWLYGDVTRWKPFVANRTRKILATIPSSHWHHVRSEDNPADCATRGLTTNQLASHSLWWEGPEWLRTFDSSKDISNDNYQPPTIEARKINVHAALHNNSHTFITELLHKYSKLTLIVNIVGWVSRFISQARGKQCNSTYSKSLSSAEIERAYNLITKEVQAQDFENDIRHIQLNEHVHSSSRIYSLNPFIDEHGLLRVGGRLRNSIINDSAKHPIILSNHSRFTELVINQAHLTTLHGGPRLTLSYIRDKFWIISGIRTVKRQLRTCVKCRRFKHDNRYQIMADLPRARVIPSRPFTHTGVDFTGHVELKANKGRGIKTVKGYVAVFVCLSTKAIHLELVSDLTTPSFLAAFRRFCARRGTPDHMYSDNGTNFIGANRVMKKEYQEIMQAINSDFFDDINKLNIQWHFNAPAWPSAGGLWEAAVKSLKYHLKRVIGDQRLTYEEFTTLLHQIEACLNSRPLCELTESPEDDYLTPGHFLVGGPLLSRPQTEPHSSTLSKRWQLVQAMNKHFWKKWSSEYLQQLQARSKWVRPTKNLDVDDIVLVKDDNLPPGKWAMGRIQKLHPGNDGYIRVVTLISRNNFIKRPISKLVLLPVNDDASYQAPLKPDKATKLSDDSPQIASKQLK